MSDPHRSHTSTTRTERGHDTALIIRVILIAAILVALVLVALDNRAHVRVGYVVGHKQGPVWVVMVASAAAGVLIGWLIKHRPHRH